MNESIFREYDIRGIADTDLTDEDVSNIASAFATYSDKFNVKKICVGRDCRLSSERIFNALTDKLIDYGLSIFDVGIVTTPVLYFSLFTMDVDGGIMITASHNPPDYNGFKASIGKNVLSSNQIQELKMLIRKKDYIIPTEKGSIEKIYMIDNYIDDLNKRISISKKIRVGIDCANTPIGLFVNKVFTKLGCESYILFEEPDGNFPNHHPDPSIESNLSSLKDLVLEKKLDIGIAFDGDGDRLGVIDNEGCFISSDIILLILAKSILASNPEAKIIGEVKCTKVLFDEVLKSGGIPIMWKTGHSKIKEKIKEENALLAGELSGHIFFKDKHYGYDDALYAALRLIEIISNSDKKLSDFLSEIPNVITTPEFRIEFSEDEKFSAVDKIIKEFQSDLRDYKISEIDGMRLENESGWALIRASNTQPALTMRFESDSIENLNILQKYVKDKIEKAIGMKCKF